MTELQTKLNMLRQLLGASGIDATWSEEHGVWKLVFPDAGPLDNLVWRLGIAHAVLGQLGAVPESGWMKWHVKGSGAVEARDLAEAIVAHVIETVELPNAIARDAVADALGDLVDTPLEDSTIWWIRGFSDALQGHDRRPEDDPTYEEGYRSALGIVAESI